MPVSDVSLQRKVFTDLPHEGLYDVCAPIYTYDLMLLCSFALVLFCYFYPRCVLHSSAAFYQLQLFIFFPFKLSVCQHNWYRHNWQKKNNGSANNGGDTYFNNCTNTSNSGKIVNTNLSRTDSSPILQISPKNLRSNSSYFHNSTITNGLHQSQQYPEIPSTLVKSPTTTNPTTR